MAENMSIYENFRSVPDEAKKTIKAGKLQGFTDINPMWRIKKLTEQFGVCGFGWYTEITNKWIEKGQDGRDAAFIEINLYVKQGGEWSKPIVGVGGSMFTNVFKGKQETSDEAFKMAYTDAISIACKALGMAADVYYEKDRTKYNANDNMAEAAEAPKESYPVAEKESKKEYATEEQCDEIRNAYQGKPDLLNKALAKHGVTSVVQLNRMQAQSLIDRINVAKAKAGIEG